ncbi:hypothetical protein ACU27_27010, partial [Klebsiella variicola]|uniref:hypothetical protein n=1 Tax=Klebsiella variicola TaxID=244366 RepID=UPI0006A093B4
GIFGDGAAGVDSIGPPGISVAPDGAPDAVCFWAMGDDPDEHAVNSPVVSRIANRQSRARVVGFIMMIRG